MDDRSAGGVSFSLEHADRVDAAFRGAPAQMRREMRRAYQQVGREVRGWIRSEAGSGSRQQARMAKGIGSAATSTYVSITVGNTASAPGARGAFYGAKKYQQFPRWVGTSWKPLTRGQGPAHSQWIARHEAEIETVFVQGQRDALARALPKF